MLSGVASLVFLSFAPLAQARANAEDGVRIVVDAKAPIDVVVGDAIFIETRVSLRGTVAAHIVGAFVAEQSARGVSYLPYIEIVASDDGSRSARVRRGLRVGVDADVGETRVLRARIELREAPSERVVAKLDVVDRIEVRANDASLDAVEMDRRTFLGQQNSALALYERLGPARNQLRLDRIEKAPPPKRVPAGLEVLLGEFLAHRFRAEAARGRLRAAADSGDAAIASAAVRAIGGLSTGPTGMAARALAIDDLAIGAALDLVARALEDLRIDDAEGFLDRLRASRRMNKDELARALAYLGAVHVARGKDDLAFRAFGQAFCISDSRGGRLRRAFFRDAFDDAERAKKCTALLSVTKVTARRVPVPEGSAFRVSVEFGEDPHGLVAAANIALWGTGGSVRESNTVRVELEKRTLETEFRALGTSDDDLRQLYLRVLLEDATGVVVASRGDPTPVAVTIADLESEASSFSIPWWIWALAGGVVVAGGATAAIVLLPDRETKYAFGPVDVTF